MNPIAVYILFSMVCTALLLVAFVVSAAYLAVSEFLEWKRRIFYKPEPLPLLKDYVERGYR